MDRQDVEIDVLCRRESAQRDVYADVGIGYDVDKSMPKVTSVPAASRNLILFSTFFVRDWPRGADFRASLQSRLKDYDLVHFNHESLFYLARWIRRRAPEIALTMHIRTQPWRSPFARWQASVAAGACDAFVFITENERNNFQALSGRTVIGDVIYNPVTPPSDGAPWPAAVPDDSRLKAVVLSNYSYNRGIDRLVPTAKALRTRGIGDILFVVAGDMQLPRSLPGELGRVARAGGSLADFTENEGVSDMFLFLGHVPNPESVLAAGDVLLKPSRENNPWGRDILEALAAGLPVASVGTYDRFVESGITGLLQSEFDAMDLASWLADLANDARSRVRMGQEGRHRVARLCDATTQGNRLRDFWRTAAGSC